MAVQRSAPVSHVVRPRSYAAFNSGSDSSSSMTQGCHLLEPMDMAPKMGTETRKPLLPSCLYSAFDSFRRPWISSLSAGMIAVCSARIQISSGERVRAVALRHRQQRNAFICKRAGNHCCLNRQLATAELMNVPLLFTGFTVIGSVRR
jgi:hypothetical protein